MSDKLSAIFSDSPCLTRGEMLAYLKGNLSGAELHRVELHLAACEFCTDALEGLKTLSANTVEEILESTDSAVYKSIQPEKESRAFIRRVMAMTAVVLVLIVASFIIDHYLSKNKSQVAENIKPVMKDNIREDTLMSNPKSMDANKTITGNNAVTRKAELLKTTPSAAIANANSTNVTSANNNVSVSADEEQAVQPPVKEAEANNPNMAVAKKAAPMAVYSSRATMDKMQTVVTDTIDAFYFKGINQQKLKHYTQAIACFNKVLLYPQNKFYQQAQWQKALILIGEGNNTDAQGLLNQIILKGGMYKGSAQQKLNQIK